MRDNRNIGGSLYCTDVYGHPCKYETEGWSRMTTACTLFRTSRGPKALRLGNDLQSMRCAECRNTPPGSSIPDLKHPVISMTDPTPPATPIKGINHIVQSTLPKIAEAWAEAARIAKTAGASDPFIAARFERVS